MKTIVAAALAALLVGVTRSAARTTAGAGRGLIAAVDRRRALQSVAAGVTAALAAPRSLFAADYDLVIRGGRVLDPGDGLRRPCRRRNQ